jgi:hypothetical protein
VIIFIALYIYCTYNLASKGLGCRKQESILGYDHTTLRRHMQWKHRVYIYNIFYNIFYSFSATGPIQELVQKK